MKPSTLCLAVLATLFPGAAIGGVIGIYADPNCSTCSIDVETGVPFEVYVSATAPELEIDNIVGAEFRITGIPPSWVVAVEPNPSSAIVLGDVLAGGVNIGFADPQTGPCWSLYTLTLSPTDQEAHVFRIEKHTSPAEQYIDCPALQIAPFEYYYTCADASDLIVNGGGCNVSVDQITWSGVRQLFR